MSTATILPFPPESSETTGAIERYRHAYHVAQTTTDFAETVKLGGIFLGGVFVVAATIAYQLSRAWHSGFPVASLSLLACAIVAVLASHVWERVFQAQGRLLEMTVDAAVNSSPFLSNAQRAVAMSLRQEAANVTSMPAKIA
jgi:uncharacterized membrane protein